MLSPVVGQAWRGTTVSTMPLKTNLATASLLVHSVSASFFPLICSLFTLTTSPFRSLTAGTCPVSLSIHPIMPLPQPFHYQTLAHHCPGPVSPPVNGPHQVPLSPQTPWSARGGWVLGDLYQETYCNPPSECLSTTNRERVCVCPPRVFAGLSDVFRV